VLSKNFSHLRKHSFYAPYLILSLFIFSKSFSHTNFFIIVLLNKILISRNNVIKYNLINLCFDIKYLHPPLSLNFSIYFLAKYRIVFTWFSHKIIAFFYICASLHNIFFTSILFNWFHIYVYFLFHLIK
jgi:hypothetical protein